MKNEIIYWCWLLVPVAEALLQKLIFFKDGKVERPNYAIVNTIRGMLAILHGAIFNVSISPFMEWPALLCFQIGSHMVIFDPLLNALRGMRPVFTYEGENSGWLKFLPYYVQAVIGCALVAYSIIYFY